MYTIIWCHLPVKVTDHRRAVTASKEQPIATEALERLVADRTAILVVDMLNDFVHPEGRSAQRGNDVERIASIVPAIRHMVDSARPLGASVVWVRQQNLPDGRSDSPAWLAYKLRNGRDPLSTVAGTWGQQLLDEFDPHPEDLVVDKARPSAFTHSPLDGLLRANSIDGVVIVGCVTEGCVEATVRDAAYHDYAVCVAEDAVASIDPVLHDGSMHFLRSRFPTASADKIVAWLGAEGIPLDR